MIVTTSVTGRPRILHLAPSPPVATVFFDPARDDHFVRVHTSILFQNFY